MVSSVDETRGDLAQAQSGSSLLIPNDSQELVSLSYDWSGVRTRRIRALKIGVSAIITTTALAVPAAILLGGLHWNWCAVEVRIRLLGVPAISRMASKREICWLTNVARQRLSLFSPTARVKCYAC